ncbi:MAG: antibiotic biosynthesis monooxygenase [Gammaproteobacteria bacterium]|nr:antibiotic biosynthesis monooxygenase [Gammaproteobacteria bacterium]
MTTLTSPLHSFSTPGLQLLGGPKAPYYAVVSSTIYNGKEKAHFESLANEMMVIVNSLPGFLGLETSSEVMPDGRVFSLSSIYWDSLESIDSWRKDPRHIAAKNIGKTLWYDEHNMRVCQILSQYGTSFKKSAHEWPKSTVSPPSQK